MANPAITKGSTVEVSISEPGFHGAWYVATVVDEAEISPEKKRKKKKKKKNRNEIGYLVEYDSLIVEDSVDEPLTEVVDASSVRPVPPRNVCRDGDGIATEEFEVDDVVDAYHREGWWIGVVKKVIVIDEGEVRKYVVAFENPPEEVEFVRDLLRIHVDWIDGCWKVAPKKKKTPKQELADRNATHTSDDAHSGFTTPSKGALTTGLQLSSKKKSRSQKKTESKSGTAGDVNASVPSSRNKKRIKNPIAEDSHGKKSKSSAGSKGKTKNTVPVMEKCGSYAIHQKSPLTGHERVTERKRERQPKSLAKSPISLLQGGHEVITDHDEPPLSPLSASSCHRVESLNQAIVTNVGTTNYQHNWPFIKRSPAWSTIASLYLQQSPPQKPHFSPLKNMKEDHREGSAIAKMVTFWNLVQRLSDLQLTDPVDIINDKLETLADLETHGFDVGAIRGRLKELLSLKSKVGQLEDKLKEGDKEIEKINGEKCLEEKERSELKVKVQEMQEKMEEIERTNKVKDEKIKRLQANMDLVTEQISDWEVAFKKLAGTCLICK